MRIAISGSSGLIGTAVAKRLRQQFSRQSNELQLMRFVRHSDANFKPGPDDMWDANIEWSPSEGVNNPSRCETLDAVIHLAGRSIGAAKWTPQEKQLIRSSRVDATSVLATQLADLQRPPEVVVSASAVGIYGNRGTEIIDEDCPADADDFLGEVALSWERSCDPLRDAGVRVVHPRFGIVLAEDGGALAKMLPLFRWGAAGRLGSGQQYWSWVDLQDVVSAVVWMLGNKDATGPYNVVSPNPVTNLEFTKQLGDFLNRPAVIPAPAFALRLALGEMADALLLSSCRAVPKRLLEQGFSFTHPELLDAFRAQL